MLSVFLNVHPSYTCWQGLRLQPTIFSAQDEEEVPPESVKEGKEEDGKEEAPKEEAAKETQEDSEKSAGQEKSQEKTEEAGSKTDTKVWPDSVEYYDLNSQWMFSTHYIIPSYSVSKRKLREKSQEPPRQKKMQRRRPNQRRRARSLKILQWILSSRTSSTPLRTIWHPQRKSKTALWVWLWDLLLLLLFLTTSCLCFQAAGSDRQRPGQAGAREDAQQPRSFYLWDTGKREKALCIFSHYLFCHFSLKTVS